MRICLTIKSIACMADSGLVLYELHPAMTMSHTMKTRET